jgi:outer membrane murein-binding lipoprotein Lpp
MNPEKRFGQIEEVLAEALIKIDRIEDLATKTFSIAETAKANGETTARAVANLTIENQQAHQQLNDKIDGLNDKFDGLKEEVSQIMIFLREKFS